MLQWLMRKFHNILSSRRNDLSWSGTMSWQKKHTTDLIHPPQVTAVIVMMIVASCNQNMRVNDFCAFDLSVK